MNRSPARRYATATDEATVCEKTLTCAPDHSRATAMFCILLPQVGHTK
ncbi:hypothetical protein [Halapricum desulfuricans]|nr:hypothetical protein [Halapricum desulfuricans]